MPSESVWSELRERCEDLGPDEYLVTPSSERAFTIVDVDPDRITIEYREAGEERTLWRDQFAVLADRLEADGGGLSLDDLPAGVEPYVSVLSLVSSYAVDEPANAIRKTTNGGAGPSPFVREEWEVRTRAERVRDDALLLADLFRRYDVDALEALPTDGLVDLYVLLSDVQRGADRLRRQVGEHLLDYIGPNGRLHGQFGTVARIRRDRRRLKDDDEIFGVLDDHGIPREWVVGVDREKLDVVVAATEVEEDDVYDRSEQVYVQKAEVEEDEKHHRLQGLADQAARLETPEARDLREEIDQLETRLDELLAAG